MVKNACCAFDLGIIENCKIFQKEKKRSKDR